KRKPPRSAAVQITASDGASYADTLRLAKSKINIGELGITEIKPRRAKTGALLLEISGPDNELKADELASKLEEVFQEKEDIRISRPTKSTELRLVGLDDSTSSMDILLAITSQTECNQADVKIGPIRQSRNRMGSTLIKCPITTANKLIDQKKLLIGWSIVRIVPLPVRRLQCHKCWDLGHVRAECKSSKDRSKACYRCGREDHLILLCPNEARCVICEEHGTPSNHRMGGPSCDPTKRGLPRRPTTSGVKAIPPLRGNQRRAHHLLVGHTSFRNRFVWISLHSRRIRREQRCLQLSPRVYLLGRWI
ncbi:hypothetical protein ALC62_00711, partial [Cyphomyrmex costatus]